MLTRKQLDLLKYIHAAVQKDGVSPSFDEMKEALDLRSKSGIHRLITALEERGFIRRLAHRARAIEILKYPDGFEGAPTAPSAEILKPAFGVRADPVQTLPALEAQAVPIYGKMLPVCPSRRSSMTGRSLRRQPLCYQRLANTMLSKLRAIR